MKRQVSSRLRQQITREAARLMLEEEVKQYYTAKRMAAARIAGGHGGRQARFRPRDLPSNGEIRDAMLEQVRLTDGHLHSRRLFAMRVVALQTMEALEPFDPRLIGSVATGHVRRGSDIDLHVFPEKVDDLEAHLFALGWPYELGTVSIRKGGEFRDFVHVYVEAAFPVEMSVYDPREKRMVSRSSTDGQPIRRLKLEAVRALLRLDHADEWADFQRTGEIPDLEELRQARAWPDLALDEEEDLDLEDNAGFGTGLDLEDGEGLAHSRQPSISW